MLICAFLVLPIVYASITDNLWVSVDFNRHRGGGASGLVSEHLHIRVGYVPETSGRFGRRHRRNGWFNRRNDYCFDGRADSRRQLNRRQYPERQLFFNFRHCGFGISDGVTDYAPARAKT